MKRFQKKLDELKRQNRYRALQLPGGVDLTSNDYLGMRSHPALRTAAIKALEDGLDIGSGGSRLLRGHTQEHQALETFAADYFKTESALYFATGFQANTALFTALPQRSDTIIFDALIHASARDGIQASHAKHIRAAHNDLASFEDALKRAEGQRWIAVESLYSMDGDMAPLVELYALANAYDAYLIVDEAHASGVLGEGGKGLAAPFLPAPNIITLHTCGKAIGVAGGLICGPAEMIEMLINTARPFIYSTAPMPLQAVLVQKSLEILASLEGDTLRTTLSLVCDHVKSKLGGSRVDLGGWDMAGEPSHIVPLIFGADEDALAAAAHLKEAGYDIRAIRPPTVPEGTARLRLSLHAHLTEAVIDDFVEHLMNFKRGRKAA